MIKTLELKKEILINGKQVKELTYDIEEITVELFIQAESNKNREAGRENSSLSICETDFSLHLYLGMAAIIAVNPQYDFKDLARIKGIDVMKVMGIGRNFILKLDQSQEDSSDEQSEITANSITQEQQTSDEENCPILS